MSSDTACKQMLVAGIGNIFLGDDAFGSEVARRLGACCWPAGVNVVDFGIRGIDLVYALLDNYDQVVLIDATRRGQPPGTVYLIEPSMSCERSMAPPSLVNGHSLDPLSVLQTALSMGAVWNRLFLVGCEPADLGGEQGRLGLSDVVHSAMDAACEMVEELIERFAGQPH